MRSSAQNNPKFNHPFLILILGAAIIMSAPAVLAATHDVTVGNNFFEPKELTIQPGDTVRWTNPSDMARSHDVTADDGSFNSVTASEFVFEVTFDTVRFDTPGTIPYHCTVHSRSAASGGTVQNGTIVIMPAATSPEISIDSVDVTDGEYQVGDSVDVTARLTNSGDGDTGAFNVTFSASSDSEVPIGPTELGTVAINNIAAGASMNINASFELPASMTTGLWSIDAVSDLADSNSGNDSNADSTPIFVFTEFIINAGLNDAWFNKATDGQGFFITVFPKLEFILLAWFTYDTEQPPAEAMANLGDPGHRWLTAVGPIEGSTAVMTVEIASGGIFDIGGGVTRVEDGTITLQFDNCNEGTATYNIPSINMQGEVPIVRVAKDNVKLCRSLLQDLNQ